MIKILRFFYYKIIISIIIYILLNISSQTINNFYTNICTHNFYKTKEIDPTEELIGKIFYTCGFCGEQSFIEIPKLSSENYYVEEIKANCEHGNGKKYTLKNNKNRVYVRTDNVRYNHTIYGHKCSVCNKTIGEFDFHKLSDFHCYGYPRLYLLSEYWNNTWLLGGDNGTILCHRSNDEGLTWSEPSLVSNFPDHFCSNVDFFELPNHDIICSYRAIGRPDKDNPMIKYNRKIFSSISKDGGKTWKELGLIIDNFALSNRLGKSLQEAYEAVIHEPNVGFFEPFVQYFNNTITVIYADDFTPMLLLLTGSVMESRKEQSIYSHTYDMSSKRWSKKRKLIMNGYIKKSPTKSGLNKKISRDGMPVTDVMKDGTYVMVFEGTYRRESYKYFTGGKLEEYHPFEIVISYSKDGENWSNPVEIYHGHNKGSKYSAPYICITETNQLIISFQTDENSVNSGYIGDLYSIMKIIISKPGIPLEEINRDSFFAVTNNNRSPIGGASLWSGMMLIGNMIYTCSSGHPILYSDLPVYDDPIKYNEILKAKYKIEVGNANFFGNKIISKGKNSIIINRNIKLNSSINIYTYVMPNIIGDCGLIFGFDKNIYKTHFLYLINKEGYLLFQKKINNEINELLPKNELIHQDYNKENIYKMNINYDSSSNEIIAGLNDQEIFKITDKYFKNSKIGFISSDNGTIFTQLLIE